MKDRITHFLTTEGISPAEFADKIGVQRSSVSHVLNGRNYPSASFIQKILGSYKTLNPRWLLLGEGTMSDNKYVGSKEPSLFQIAVGNDELKSAKEAVLASESLGKDTSTQQPDNLADKTPSSEISNQFAESKVTPSVTDFVSNSIDYKEVERIVFFFKDKTFTTYMPSK